MDFRPGFHGLWQGGAELDGPEELQPGIDAFAKHGCSEVNHLRRGREELEELAVARPGDRGMRELVIPLVGQAGLAGVEKRHGLVGYSLGPAGGVRSECIQSLARLFRLNARNRLLRVANMPLGDSGLSYGAELFHDGGQVESHGLEQSLLPHGVLAELALEVDVLAVRRPVDPDELSKGLDRAVEISAVTHRVSDHLGQQVVHVEAGHSEVSVVADVGVVLHK